MVGATLQKNPFACATFPVYIRYRPNTRLHGFSKHIERSHLKIPGAKVLREARSILRIPNGRRDLIEECILLCDLAPGIFAPLA